ncbi:hypothetical protein BH20VER1_BH20VER1_11650 [soil metagenome]
MRCYADSAFITPLLLQESSTVTCERLTKNLDTALPLIPLAQLEVRNAMNAAIARGRITAADRDALWRQFEAQIRSGAFVEVALPTAELHRKAMELSDRYTPRLATRSLDLLHVAAALLLEAEVFFSFDARQREAAAGEGLQVKP